MNPKCIYEVRTKYWGIVRVDEATYKDFQAGRSWLCHGMNIAKKTAEAVNAPANISEEALKLRKQCKTNEPYSVFRKAFANRAIIFPYKEKMSSINLDTIVLSVRSTNALRRAGVDCLGKVMKLINSERGLQSARNLGKRSEEEIIKEFFNACYSNLNEYEQAAYWQELISVNPDD